MLDEPALRREVFVPRSIPVVMADGQAWFLPPPGVTVYLDVESSEDRDAGYAVPGIPGLVYPTKVREKLRYGSAHGREHDETLRRLDEAMSSPNEHNIGEVIALMFAVARTLLSRNYAIPDEGWSELIRYNLDSDEYLPMWRDVISVAHGELAPPELATVEA